MSDNVQPFRLFNGKVANKATKIFGGESSGIRDWDDVKYPSMLEINKQLFSEYWVEDEIKLGKDIEQYRNVLSDPERYVYNIITGMLTTLDSFATDFNFILGYLCSDSSVRSNIALINSFEVLHNRSYQYLTSSMLTQAEKEQAFNASKEIPLLMERNQLVIDKMQKVITMAKDYIQNDKSFNDEILQAIFEGIVAYLCLEGEFFSGGFVYFHSLARDSKMLASNNMINLIKQDENQHNVFFGMLLQILLLENPQLNTQENMDFAVNFIKTAAEKEKEWSTFLFKDINTLSIKEYYNYIEYLANVICRNAGIKEVYPDNKALKSSWIVTYGSKKRDTEGKGIATRADFLQGNVINYSHTEGGDDFDM